MRVLLDTNILVRAASPGGGVTCELLDRCISDPHTLWISPILLDELHRVLRYPRLVARHKLSEQDIVNFITRIESAACIVPLTQLTVVSISTDPDDDAVVATAIAAGVDVICTRDRHLYSTPVVAHCGRRGINIVGDLELLKQLRAEDDQAR